MPIYFSTVYLFHCIFYRVWRTFYERPQNDFGRLFFADYLFLVMSKRANDIEDNNDDSDKRIK